MGHIQEMTEGQRVSFMSDKYQKLKESRRGCSYPYWNEKLHTKLISGGYRIHEFETGLETEATRVLSLAKSIVDQYRDRGYYARIICGYSQNQQRIKMYTIFYKKK